MPERLNLSQAYTDIQALFEPAQGWDAAFAAACQAALLHKSIFGQHDPNPRQTYATAATGTV